MTSYFPGEPVSVPIHPLGDISVVISSPCRTGFGCVVIAVLYKHISIYLLTACLLGMPLGHSSAENLNEDTIIMILTIKPVELTTLPQCGKEKTDEYSAEETLVSPWQMLGWKCYSNKQIFVAHVSTKTCICNGPFGFTPAHTFCPEEGGNVRFSSISSSTHLSQCSLFSFRVKFLE